MTSITQLALLDSIPDENPQTNARAAGKAEYMRRWRARNPGRDRESANESGRRWRARNREKTRAVARKNHILATYGLTPDAFDRLLESQGNVCAICGSDEHSGKNWDVDHDHATGETRGILCHRCNLGLGHMRDSPALLRAAADYLERHQE